MYFLSNVPFALSNHLSRSCFIQMNAFFLLNAPYTLKYLKSNLLHLKRSLEILKSFKWDVLHLKCALHFKYYFFQLKIPWMVLSKPYNTQASQISCKPFKSYVLKSKHIQTSQHSNLSSHVFLESKHLWSFQISPWTLKVFKSNASEL